MDVSNNHAIKICKKLNEEFIELKFLSGGEHNENYFLKTKTE